MVSRRNRSKDPWRGNSWAWGDEVAAKLWRPQSYVSERESGDRQVNVVEFVEFARLYKKELEFFVK